MVFELEDLWPDRIPELGDPGECTHCEPTPGPTTDCKTIKEKILIRKKTVIKAMTKQDCSVSVHVINENLHNIERLRQNWENIHFNPPHKWEYLSWKGKVPVYYHQLKQKYTHWSNSTYQLENLNDFPPLYTVPASNEMSDIQDFSSMAKADSDTMQITNSTKFNEKEVEILANETEEKIKKDISGPILLKCQNLPLSYAQVVCPSINGAEGPTPLPPDESTNNRPLNQDNFQTFHSLLEAEKMSLYLIL